MVDEVGDDVVHLRYVHVLRSNACQSRQGVQQESQLTKNQLKTQLSGVDIVKISWA